MAHKPLWTTIKWWLLHALIGKDTVIFNVQITGDLHCVEQFWFPRATFIHNLHVNDVGNDAEVSVTTDHRPEARVVH